MSMSAVTRAKFEKFDISDQTDRVYLQKSLARAGNVMP